MLTEIPESPVLTNPFPGLRSFEQDEDYLFFGREEQSDALLQKLRNSHFLAVIGASGSGKSSLVKCGLLPALHSGFMVKAGSHWEVVVCRPGNDPIGRMADSLAAPGVLYSEETQEFSFQPIIEATLRRSRKGLVDAVRESEMGPSENLLIVVDQFEEIFRFSHTEKSANTGKRDSVAFINLLLEATRQSEIPIYIVITMRSDFLGDCTEFRGLPEAINNGQYLIPRMKRSEIKTAITGPIAVAGGEISSRLIARLLNEVGDNPDHLPILQHAMMRTWDYVHEHQGPDKPLDLDAYEAIGRMNRALSQHGEEAYRELKTEREQQLCEYLFKGITEKGANARGIRRPARLGEICQLADAELEEMVAVIEVFRKPGRSFLMPPAGIELHENTIIDISHESLMRVWTRLINWVHEEAQSAELYLRLAEVAALYQEGKSGLWRDPELALALRWRETQQPNEVWGQRYETSFSRAMAFLQYSKETNDFDIAERTRQQKQRLKRARIVMIVVSALALASMIAAFWAYTAQLEAATERDNAQVAMQEAREQEQIAVTEQARADRMRQKAEMLADTAQQRQLEAELSRTEAENAREVAKANAALALAQKIEADTAKNRAIRAQAKTAAAKEYALQQKDAADLLRASADTGRLLAESRASAFVALQLIREGNLDSGRAMAVAAHELNRTNSGPQQNKANYTALLAALQAQQPNDLRFNKHRDPIKALAVSANGTRIATGDEGGKVFVNAVQGNSLVKEKALVFGNEQIRALAFSPNNQYLAVGSFGGVLQLHDLMQNRKGVEVPTSEPIRDLVFLSGTAKPYLLAATTNQLICFRLNGEALQEVARQSIPGLQAISVDQQKLAVATRKQVVLYDLSNPASISSTTAIPISGTPVAVALGSNQLVVGLQSGKVWVGDSDGKHGKVYAMHVPNSPVTALAIGSDASPLLLSGSYDQQAFLTDLDDLQSATSREDKLHLEGHDSWIHRVAFCGNSMAVTVGEDGAVKLWPLTSDQMAQTLKPQIQ